jgi:hypothetical protein
MKNLVPSFAKSGAKVLLLLFVFFLGAYLWDGFHDHKWWAPEYIASLAIPFTVAPIVIWFMFVPRRLAYSETEFVLENWPATRCQLAWSQLKYYGPGEGVFMIQFEGRQAFQILGAAFPSSDWREFVDFLSNRYPEKKASGTIGSSLFRWRK